MRLAILALTLLPVLYADQVTLTNGDVLTGAIVKKDGDKLTLHSEFLGDVTMPWSAIKSLRSDKELTVVLPNNETVHGAVSTTGNELRVAAPGQPRTAPLTAVAAVRNDAEQHAYERLEHPGWLDLWAGTVDLGYALARGNARTETLTTNFNVSRVTGKTKITARINQIYGSARVNGVTSTTANAIRGGWTFDDNLSPRLFATVMNDYEHDQFQNLNLRFVAGGGLGYNAVKTESRQLDLSAGVNLNRENFANLSRSFGEANFGDNAQFKLSGVTTLTQSFRIFSNLSDTGQYRVNFDLTTATVLKKWLSWQVTGSDRFLSNPVFGRQRNDLLLSTGFRFSFAK